MVSLRLWNRSFLDLLPLCHLFPLFLLLLAFGTIRFLSFLLRCFIFGLQVRSWRAQLLQKVGICRPCLLQCLAALLRFLPFLPIVIHMLHLSALKRLQVFLPHSLLHRPELLVLGPLSLLFHPLLGYYWHFLRLAWRFVKQFHVVNFLTTWLLFQHLLLPHILIV